VDNEGRERIAKYKKKVGGLHALGGHHPFSEIEYRRFVVWVGSSPGGNPLHTDERQIPALGKKRIEHGADGSHRSAGGKRGGMIGGGGGKCDKTTALSEEPWRKKKTSYTGYT